MRKCETIILRNENDLKEGSSLMLGKLNKYKELTCTVIVHVAIDVDSRISPDNLVDGISPRNALDRVSFPVQNEINDSITVN